jgi:hypothetical protein
MPKVIMLRFHKTTISTVPTVSSHTAGYQLRRKRNWTRSSDSLKLYTRSSCRNQSVATLRTASAYGMGYCLLYSSKGRGGRQFGGMVRMA